MVRHLKGERAVKPGKECGLALLAALAHFHRDVRDEEHAEEAPGDDLEIGAHAKSPAAIANDGCIGSFTSKPKVRNGRKLTKRRGPIKMGKICRSCGLSTFA